jgi:predicted ATPase
MQKIVVRNFRQISIAEIEVKKILLLIGEQASGKSTIAKLIYFFKSLKQDYFNLVYRDTLGEEGMKDLQLAFIQNIKSKFEQYFGYVSDYNSDFEIFYYYNFIEEKSPHNRFIKLSRNSDLLIHFEFSFFREIVNNTQGITKKINNLSSDKKIDIFQYLDDDKTQQQLSEQLSKTINEVFFDDYVPMFFPAGRNITVSYSEQFQALFLLNLFGRTKKDEDLPNSVDMVLMKSFILHTKFLQDYFKGASIDSMVSHQNSEVSTDIFNFFKKHSEYILQGKYDNHNGNEKLVYDHATNKSVPLNLSSSGQQESVRIIQDLLYILIENEKSFRIIEEPEAHLYAKAQKKLVELIALTINKTDSQILLTTHSPYILSILNNLLTISLVRKNNSSAVSKIDNHFETKQLDEAKNERIHIFSNEIQAYALSIHNESYCTSIIDKETGLIGDNYLDTVTEELNEDFNTLYMLNFQNQETDA